MKEIYSGISFLLERDEELKLLKSRYAPSWRGSRVCPLGGFIRTMCWSTGRRELPLFNEPVALAVVGMNCVRRTFAPQLIG